MTDGTCQNFLRFDRLGNLLRWQGYGDSLASPPDVATAMPWSVGERGILMGSRMELVVNGDQLSIYSSGALTCTLARR